MGVAGGAGDQTVPLAHPARTGLRHLHEVSDALHRLEVRRNADSAWGWLATASTTSTVVAGRFGSSASVVRHSPTCGRVTTITAGRSAGGNASPNRRPTAKIGRASWRERAKLAG